MSVWAGIACCWIGGSVPIAVLLGKMMTVGHREVCVDDLSVEVDVLLEKIFAA